MRVNHYSARELAEMLERASFGRGTGDHVGACEQCHMLLALVRRARGAPSDEEAEVTVDALKAWSVSH
jgi:hypothetical protein